MKREQLMVAAIENGTVIDHIPSNRLFEVIRLLRIEELDHDTVFIGYHLKSCVMGTKSIIKIANRFFSEQELNSLAVVAPNVTMSIIRDFEVESKFRVELPREISGIIKCNNPKCICNNEPMPTRFISKGESVECYYCEKEQELSAVKLTDEIR